MKVFLSGHYAGILLHHLIIVHPQYCQSEGNIRKRKNPMKRILL